MGDDHTPLKTIRIRQKELRFSLAFSIQSGSKYLAVQMLRGAGITQRGQNADGEVVLFEGRKKVLQTALDWEVNHVVGQRKTG